MAAEDKSQRINMVHKQTILRETIRKELKHRKFHTKYFQNPYNPVHSVDMKPNVYNCPTDEGCRDEEYEKLISHHNQQPFHKYTEPKTSAQEIGWIHEPLLKINRDDARLHWGKKRTELTTYKEKAWSLGEKDSIRRTKTNEHR